MSRLIDADKLKDAMQSGKIPKGCSEGVIRLTSRLIFEFCKLVDEQPTEHRIFTGKPAVHGAKVPEPINAQPIIEQRTAHKKFYNDSYRCSACGMFGVNIAYCPNCGAKFEGEVQG